MNSTKYLALAAIFAVATLSSAAPITVNNPSFEGGTTPGANCAFFSGGVPCLFNANTTIDQWTQNSPGNNGLVQLNHPGPNGFFDVAIPDGIQYAYSNGGTIRQTVGSFVTAGLTYTLQVDVGLRKSFPFLGIVQLLIGDPNGVFDTYTATGTAPAVGGWSTYTATYVANAADVGKAITINLVSTAAQASFDNVRLNDSTSTSGPGPSGIPEPSTYALLATGLAALIRFRKR
jgi:hypothetical protein